MSELSQIVGNPFGTQRVEELMFGVRKTVKTVFVNLADTLLYELPYFLIGKEVPGSTSHIKVCLGAHQDWREPRSQKVRLQDLCS